MGRFLQPLSTLDAPMIVNARSGQSIASGVEIATSRRARRRGLLGRDGLAAGCAFVLSPCWAVHTIGMRFPIDVVFVDEDGLVLKIVEHMAGWRMAVASAATTTIELWAGAVRAVDVQVGDRLALVSAFSDHRSPISAITEESRSVALGVRPEIRLPLTPALTEPQSSRDPALAGAGVRLASSRERDSGGDADTDQSRDSQSLVA